MVGETTVLSVQLFPFLLLLLLKSCPKPEDFLRPYRTDIKPISSSKRAFVSLQPALPPAGAQRNEDSQGASAASLAASCVRAGTTSLLLDSSSTRSAHSPAEVIALRVTCCCGDACIANTGTRCQGAEPCAKAEGLSSTFPSLQMPLAIANAAEGGSAEARG